LREAINGILEASSARFITSIAGILCHIGWTITARIYADRQAGLAGGCFGRAAFGAFQDRGSPVTPG
jgi:hypothetical protein